MKSQKQEILDYLKTGKGLTQLSCTNKFRCTRLSARILDLKNDGHIIQTIMVSRRNKRTGRNTWYAEYYLEEA